MEAEGAGREGGSVGSKRKRRGGGGGGSSGSGAVALNGDTRETYDLGGVIGGQHGQDA